MGCWSGRIDQSMGQAVEVIGVLWTGDTPKTHFDLRSASILTGTPDRLIYRQDLDLEVGTFEFKFSGVQGNLIQAPFYFLQQS